MTPAAYWASMALAGVIVAVCLLVLETTLIWASASAGGFLIVAALAYRPRAIIRKGSGDDEGELTL